ncbi:transcription elongation factor subunit Spt4 [uncultured Methanobrevibacter sp.]|uniref:transcription elongation factor subunit Spt4 n=1 Tax=uncultured Methanobrevibacter sp. TaxID=253161 RepID=UPI002612192A
MVLKACTHCSLLSEDKEQCPECKNPTSTNWSGILIITDPENSDIAKELGISKPGEYALRVR